MSTATFNQDLSTGIDLRAWDLTLLAGDTGPDAFSHGLPYTPSFSVLRPKDSLGAEFPGIAVVLTATTCTVTKRNNQNTGGNYVLYIGRASAPQNER